MFFRLWNVASIKMKHTHSCCKDTWLREKKSVFRASKVPWLRPWRMSKGKESLTTCASHHKGASAIKSVDQACSWKRESTWMNFFLCLVVANTLPKDGRYFCCDTLFAVSSGSPKREGIWIHKWNRLLRRLGCVKKDVSLQSHARWDFCARPGRLMPNFKNRADREVCRCIVYDVVLYTNSTFSTWHFPWGLAKSIALPNIMHHQKNLQHAHFRYGPFSESLCDERSSLFSWQITAKSMMNHSKFI